MNRTKKKKIDLGGYGLHRSWLLLIAISGCSTSEVEEPVQEESVEQSLDCTAKCDYGWDHWGNPIPSNATAGGFSVCSLQNQWATCGAGGWTVGASGCNTQTTPYNTKFGVNSAIPFTSDCAKESEAAAKGLGYYLEIAYGFGDLTKVQQSINCSIQQRIIPIVRICDAEAGTCQFTDPETYASFLQQLDDQVNGLFYAIAGPNEPLSEKWIPGTENINFNGWYTDDQLNTLAQKNAGYMNTVLALMNGRRRSQGGQVGLLSPAFNCTNPQIDPFIRKMSLYGADFASLDGISGNAYSLNTSLGWTISNYINVCLNALPGITSPFFLTEMGPWEADNNTSCATSDSCPHIPRTQAISNLKNQVDALRGNPRIRAALFFNGLGTSTDTKFGYGVLSPSEWSTLLSGGATLGAPTCDGPKLTVSNGFGAMPTWSSSHNASWGGAATWTIITSGGQSGSFLRATRASQGSSAKVKVYNITPGQTYTISVYMHGTSSSVNYWSELGFRLGNHTAYDFNENSGAWTLVNKFSSTGGYANGNGGVWRQYTKTFNSGSSTQISVGFKSGSLGGAGPTARWDTLNIQ